MRKQKQNKEYEGQLKIIQRKKPNIIKTKGQSNVA